MRDSRVEKVHFEKKQLETSFESLEVQRPTGDWTNGVRCDISVRIEISTRSNSD
jgi:hypothetical protein